MTSPDDVNNRRIRQLIEQFNAEEFHAAERRSIVTEWDQLIASGADLKMLIVALARARRRFLRPPPVKAIGMWIEHTA